MPPAKSNPPSASAPPRAARQRAARRSARAAIFFALGFLIGAALAVLLWASEPGAPFRFVYEAF